MRFVDIKNDVAFRKIADKHNWSKEALLAYDNAGMREQDARGEKSKAISNAVHDRNIEIARKLLIKGLDVHLVAETTGLSIEEVQEIADELTGNK